MASPPDPAQSPTPPSPEQDEAARFEKFRSAVNWAQEQAGFPTFVVVCGFFEGANRFYAAHMAMTASSTAKDEITMQPLLAATFAAAIRAQCESYIRQIVRTLFESGRGMNAPEEDLKRMCDEFESAFRQRMKVEEENFLAEWSPR